MHSIFPVSLSGQQVVTAQPVYVSSTKHAQCSHTHYEWLIRSVTLNFPRSSKTPLLLSAFELFFPGAIIQCSTSSAHTAIGGML